MKKTLIFASSLMMLVGCSEARFEKATSFNNPRTIKCYSGGVEIYSGRSTGRIQSEQSSDGYYFVDARTNKLTEVSGDCILTAIKE